VGTASAPADAAALAARGRGVAPSTPKGRLAGAARHPRSGEADLALPAAKRAARRRVPVALPAWVVVFLHVAMGEGPGRR